MGSKIMKSYSCIIFIDKKTELGEKFKELFGYGHCICIFVLELLLLPNELKYY